MNPYLISLRSTTTSPSLSILYSRTPCRSSSSTVTNFFPTVLSCIYSKSRFSLIVYQNSSCQDHQRYSYCYYQLPILLLIALSVAPNIIDTLLPESFFFLLMSIISLTFLETSSQLLFQLLFIFINFNP